MGVLVSIIICTVNHAEFLQATLTSLTKLDIPSGINVEFVVVDNGSQDHTCDVVRSFADTLTGLKYVLEPRRGQSYARNTGMANAQGDIFLWTDDDVTLPPSWIGEMTAPLLSGEYQGAGGRIRMNASLERPWMTKSHYVRLADTRCWPDDLAALVGANMAFTREVLQKVPAFDVELGPGQLGFRDDTLFYSQMKVAGFKLTSVPHCVVEHNFEPSRLKLKAWIRNAELSGNSSAYMSHHWQHDTVDHLRARAILWKAGLRCFRATQGRKSPDEEGCHRFELKAIQNASLYDSLAKLASTPRHYDRLGLIKKG